MLRLASIRAAVENLEISQLDMQAAFLKGLLTSDDHIPMKLPPRIAENDNVIWTRRTKLERLVDVVVNEEIVFRRCGNSVIVVEVQLEAHTEVYVGVSSPGAWSLC